MSYLPAISFDLILKCSGITDFHSFKLTLTQSPKVRLVWEDEDVFEFAFSNKTWEVYYLDPDLDWEDSYPPLGINKNVSHILIRRTYTNNLTPIQLKNRTVLASDLFEHLQATHARRDPKLTIGAILV